MMVEQNKKNKVAMIRMIVGFDGAKVEFVATETSVYAGDSSQGIN
jgi:hypothetical protein